MSKRKFISRSKNVYNEYPAPDKLKKYVDKVFEFTCNPLKNQSVTFHLIPSYFSSILFIRFSKSKECRLLVSGPNIKSNPIKTREKVKLISIRFMPLLLPIILNVKPSHLMNRLTELEKLTGKEAAAILLSSISRSYKTENILNQLSNFIIGKIPVSFDIERDIAEAIKSIMAVNGNIKLSEIYDKITMSKRNFQRKFHEHSGLTPKEFCKIARFEAASRNLVLNNYKHFDVLWESGYYDQSHYNKEFKEYAGLAPSAFGLRQKTISYRNILK